jgi:hypothetical protein
MKNKIQFARQALAVMMLCVNASNQALDTEPDITKEDVKRFTDTLRSFAQTIEDGAK